MATKQSLTELLEKFRESAAEGRPCVLYAKPEEDTVTGLFQRTADQHAEFGSSDSGFVFESFSGEKRIFIPVAISDTFSAPIAEVPESHQPAEFSSSGKEHFMHLAEEAIASIKSGKSEKIVISRREVHSYEFGLEDAFCRLLVKYKTAFRYLLFHPESGIWMGATPERLIKIQNGEFSIMSLAGTQPKSAEPYVWGRKEREEQQYVTDYIVDAVKPFADCIHVTPVRTEFAGNIVHLRSDITGKFVLDDLLSLVKALHPTPAICGLPRESALEFLRAHEGYDREFYSGFLGELNMTEETSTAADLYVNLRCLKVDGPSVTFFIGCGITADSVPEKEYEETVNKSMTLKTIL